MSAVLHHALPAVAPDALAARAECKPQGGLLPAAAAGAFAGAAVSAAGVAKAYSFASSCFSFSYLVSPLHRQCQYQAIAFAAYQLRFQRLCHRKQAPAGRRAQQACALIPESRKKPAVEKEDLGGWDWVDYSQSTGRLEL